MRLISSKLSTSRCSRSRDSSAVASNSARSLSVHATSALLNAVSHDLRTPLASAKAAVTGLRSADVAWTDSERAELLATADESLDRLHRLVDNLLDMSRIQAGALSILSLI